MRVFPDWYKPYGMNYTGHGWLAFFLASFFIGGYSYLNDIKDMKGRKTRKVYWLRREDTKDFNEQNTDFWVKRQLEKGDPNFVKFTIQKPRAPAHH